VVTNPGVQANGVCKVHDPTAGNQENIQNSFFHQEFDYIIRYAHEVDFDSNNTVQIELR